MEFSDSYRKVATGRSRRASAPGVGPYYWIPGPDGSWSLGSLVYRRDETPPDHDTFWKRSVSAKIATLWGRPDIESRIRPLFYAVPRGRVSFFDGMYYINHGDDAPLEGWLRLVLQDYRLSAWAQGRPDRLKVAIDPHERMNPTHREALARILGEGRDLAVASRGRS